MAQGKPDKEIDEWLASIPSQNTRKQYCENIFRFAQSPARLLNRPIDEVEKFVTARVGEMNRTGLSSVVIRLPVAAFKNFLEFHDVELRWKKIMKYLPTMKPTSKRSPQPPPLGSIPRALRA